MKVFIDTGAICAAVISGDAHNRTAKNVFLSLQERNAAMFTCPLDAIIDIASECKDLDLSINHDKYLYGDDPL